MLQIENEELHRRIADTDNLFEVCGLTSHDLIECHNILIQRNLDLQELLGKIRDEIEKKDMILQE